MAASRTRVVLSLAALVSALAAVPSAAVAAGPANHVLLLSVDGMHQSDLAWYVQHHPGSNLAHLVSQGMEFTGAQTPFPSDSYPGMVGQTTGGNPSSTGVYYDDTYNHALLPPGTTSCAGAAAGTEIPYIEVLNINLLAFDAGEGLAGLPGSILQMTANPDQVLVASALPVDPASCSPVYPHQYLQVNTIFEVARAAGLRTAWSDKHPAYEILNGPSGTGVQDFFTPDINSNAPTIDGTGDWTSDNQLTMQYDGYKVQAVINEIDGFDHSGATQVGTPAIFGMNFQTVSTAQKLPASDGMAGGYLADGLTPGPLVARGLDFIDQQIGRFVTEIRNRHLDKDTVIILSAKHGQSPMRPSALTRIPDGPILDALNAAWQSANPSGVQPLVAFSTDDTGLLLWFNDRSAAATDFAKNFLLGYSGVGNDINGNPKAYTQSGLTSVLSGAAAAAFIGVQPGDPRVPDLIGLAQYGSLYTGHQAKISDHGGINSEDRAVPLVVSGGPVGKGGVVNGAVETTQIAPTILSLLGLDPNFLQAVRIEQTATLPLH